MDGYLGLVPSELIEIIICRLDNDDLDSFIQLSLPDNLYWSRVLEYHFGSYRRVTETEYIRYLDIEKLKEKWKLASIGYSVGELINLQLQEFYLNGEKLKEKITEIPKEIGQL